MGEEAEKLSGKLGIDTSDLKTALATANRELRVLESGFRASAAALGDWSKDASGLELRVKSLTSQVDIQKAKVGALAEEHQRLVRENGANSRAAQDAEIKLNKETETLGKMESELRTTQTSLDEMGNASQDAAGSVDELEQSEKSATQSSGLFSRVLDGVKTTVGGLATAVTVATGAVLALGGAAIGAVGSMAGLGINTANTADELADLSAKTGISTERLQELQYAGDQIGTSLDTMTGAQARLIRAMDDADAQTDKYNQALSTLKKGAAAPELGEMAGAFARLGVSVTDGSGQLRNAEAVFADAIDALGGVQNSTERDALAMQLFGKSAQELNPLIQAGSAELSRLSQEARDMGAVMSGESVEAAAELADQLAGLKAGFNGVVNQIGLMFIPALSGIATKGKGYLQDLVAIIKNPDSTAGGKASGVGALFSRIVTDMTAQMPQMIQTGLNVVSSVITGLVSSLPTILPAAISIIQTLIQFLVQNLPMITNAAVQIILTLVQSFLPMLPMLIGAAMQIIITLANGLAEMAPTLIPAVVDVMLQIISVLIANLPMLIDAALKLIIALADGLIAALPVLIPRIPEIIQAIANALITALPMIAQAAGELIATLGAGIVAALPGLIGAAIKIIDTIYNTIGPKAMLTRMMEIGKGFVTGLWQGIQNAQGWFYSMLANFIGGMVQSIKDALGMASPSKVGKYIGRNFSGSIGMDLFAGLEQIRQALPGAMNALSQSAMAAAGARQLAAVTTNNSSESLSFYAPVIFQGDTPAGSLGDSIKGRRF